MHKRPYHHGDLAAALLARAEEMLREKGSDALSLRELARGLGVSPAAPRRHFTTKQALLDALALTGFERLTKDIATAQESAGRTFAERLDVTARAFVGFAAANSALLDLMFSAKHSPEASDALEAAAHGWVQQGLDMVAEGQRRGEVRAGDLERVALTVFAPLQGYIGLTAIGVVAPEVAEEGLADVIAAVVRGCSPD